MMSASRALLTLILVLTAVPPAAAQFRNPDHRDDPRAAAPSWAEHVGAATLGAAVLGGIGFVVGEVEVTAMNDPYEGLNRQPERERRNVTGLALLGMVGGATLGASVIASPTPDAMPYVMSGLGAGLGGFMGYAAGALASDARAVHGGGLFVGAVLGAATGAYLVREHTARRSGLRAAVMPTWSNPGLSMRLTF